MLNLMRGISSRLQIVTLNLWRKTSTDNAFTATNTREEMRLYIEKKLFSYMEKEHWRRLSELKASELNEQRKTTKK